MKAQHHLRVLAVVAGCTFLCNMMPACTQARSGWPSQDNSMPQGAPRQPDSIATLFSKLLAYRYIYRGEGPRVYDELWARRQEALPFLQQRAKGGDLLARVLVGRITDPKKYAAFEQTLTTYGKQFNNMYDPEDVLTPEEQKEADDTAAHLGALPQRRLYPRGTPHVVRLDMRHLSKWIKQLNGPLPGLEGSDAMAFLVEYVHYTKWKRDSSQVAAPLAIIALGLTKEPEAFEPLAEIVRSREPRGADYAMEGLRHLGDKRALPLLADVILDPFRWYEREKAVQVLEELGDGSVLSALDKVAAEEKRSDVREAARRAATAIRQREQQIAEGR